ncbi:MAG: hypothetical protein Q9O24_04860 [Gammaproteobacteria bacterium]|nr:hypothetical protein [Gammaproteobacteria bacterium]
MKLCIPNQEKTEFSAFCGSPRLVKRWLVEQQENTVQKSIREFFTTLKQMNREIIAPRQRLEYLESFRPMARVINNHLQKRYLSLSLPLPERSRKIFDLNLALLQEMAYGYKIVVNDGTQERSQLHNRYITLGLQRAMNYLSSVMLRCAQVYTLIPESLWYDLHQLYHYAEEKQLHELPIKDSELQRRDKLSISQIYKRALMLALAHPETLHRGEAERIYTDLEEWTELCNLQLSQNTAPLGRLFGVNLDSDKPPVSLDYLRPTFGAKIRWLDVRKLLAKLSTHMNEDEDVNSPLMEGDGLSPNAQKRLWVNWGMSIERAHSRIPKKTSAIVEIGLKAIHDSILAEVAATSTPAANKPKAAPNAFNPDMMHLQIIPIEERRNAGSSGFINHPGSRGSQIASDSWENIASGNVFNNHYEQEKEKQTEKKQNNKPQAKKDDQQWSLLNTSPGGFGLLRRGASQSKAHVGEILGLRENDRNGNASWRIGVIRWMRFLEKQTFEIGVQALSSRAFAVNVETKNPTFASEQQQECLFFPEDMSLDQPTSLLTPSHMYKVGSRANIKIMNKDMHVQFKDILRHTGFFTQFHINTSDDEHVEKKEKKQDGYFDSVWDNI